MKTVLAVLLALAGAARAQQIDVVPHQEGMAYTVLPQGDLVFAAPQLGWGMAPPIHLIHLSQVSLGAGHHHDFLVQVGAELLLTHAEMAPFVDPLAVGEGRTKAIFHLETNLDDTGPGTWIPYDHVVEQRPNESQAAFLKRVRKDIAGVLRDPAYRLPREVHGPTGS